MKNPEPLDEIDPDLKAFLDLNDPRRQAKRPKVAEPDEATRAAIVRWAKRRRKKRWGSG